MIAGLSRTGALVQMPDRPIRLSGSLQTYRRCLRAGCGPECDLLASATANIDAAIRDACERQARRRGEWE